MTKTQLLTKEAIQKNSQSYEKIFKTQMLTSETIQETLKSCEKITFEIISQLQSLEEDITSHNGKVLAAKTSGTTVTALGTGLAVTGLIMAPFTLGTSLILSSVGAVTSVSGAAANLITDLVDKSKRNKFIQNIHTLSTDQTESKSELIALLDLLDQFQLPLIDKGLTETQALFATLKGDRCTLESSDTTDGLKGDDDDEFEWVQTPNGKWKPIRKFCFKAGLNSLKLVKNTKTLSTLAGGGARAMGAGASAGGAVFNVGTRASTATVTAASGGIFARVGHFLGSAAFKGTMAAVGVVFTTIDIALLVKEWKSTNPTSETIQIVIEELKEEAEGYKKLMTKLKEVDVTKMFMAWMIKDEIPIVGTSPFAVEALKGICEGDFQRVKCLYGDVPQLTNFENVSSEVILSSRYQKWTSSSTDPKLAIFSEKPRLTISSKILPIPTVTSSDLELIIQNVLYSQQLIVGASLSLDELSNIVTRTLENPDKKATHPAEPVFDINNDILKKMVTHENTTGIRVFNCNLLNLNQEILDTFLKEESYPEWDDIKTRLQGTSVFKDYYTPLPDNVTHSIKNVLVSYHKFGAYLDGNKWEYNVTFELLKDHAVTFLREEYAKLDNKDEEGDYDSNGQDESSTVVSDLDDLVDVIINHKSFVDPLAAEIWTEGNEQKELYETCFNAISKLFRDLQFKIPLWSCEIKSAINKA